MAPVIGSDGFSDCNKLCDPKGGYSSSCTRLCKGFKVVTTELAATVHTSTETSSSSLTNLMTVSSESNESTHIAPNESFINDHYPQWVNILIGVILTIVFLFLFYFRMRIRDLFAHLLQWTITKLCKRLPYSDKEVKDEIELQMIGNRIADVTESLLEKNNRAIDDRNVVSSKGCEQYEQNTRGTTNIVGTDRQECKRDPNYMNQSLSNKENTVGPTGSENDRIESNEYGTRAVVTGQIHNDIEECPGAHVSDVSEDGEDESDTDSESNSIQTACSRLDNGTPLNGCTPINPENIVSRQSFQKKGVIRVITEIDLR